MFSVILRILYFLCCLSVSLLLFQVFMSNFSRQRQSLAAIEREILAGARQFHQERQSVAAAVRFTLTTPNKGTQQAQKKGRG